MMTADGFVYLVEHCEPDGDRFRVRAKAPEGVVIELLMDRGFEPWTAVKVGGGVGRPEFEEAEAI